MRVIEPSLIRQAPSGEFAEPSDTAPLLPNTPLFTSRANNSRLPLDLRGLWAYRELLYFLTWRDIKVRYKQTALGAAWVIIQPFFTMVIFAVFFGLLVGVPSEGIPYPLFTYAGLLPWTFFASAVTNCSNSLVGSSNLITKVYFPRVIIPAAAVSAGLLDLAIASVILVGLAIYYDMPVTPKLGMLPVFLTFATLLAGGVGVWLSALTVKYRDIRHALPFILQIWMFTSPIIYPSSVVPEKWRWVLSLNPMTGIIDGFRSALTGRAFDWQPLIISIVMTIIILICSAYSFRRIEKSFADLI